MAFQFVPSFLVSILLFFKIKKLGIFGIGMFWNIDFFEKIGKFLIKKRLT